VWHQRAGSTPLRVEGGVTMKKIFALGVALGAAVAVSGCGSVDDNETEGRTEELGEALHKGCGFEISSPAFRDGAKLPSQYTCEGKPFGGGSSPKLEWRDEPRGTKSYAIVFKDLTLVDGPFPNRAFHWAIWDIPKSIHALPKSLSADQFPAGLKGAQQLSGYPPQPYAYLGPCPAWENLCSGGTVPRALDNYSFTIYALDTKTLALPPADPNITNYVRQLDAYLQTVSIEEAELNATSDARPSAFPACPDAT
jgi:phosphatidylethanolamine-binding protein (PEBP) family uncharacterized protein